MRMRARTFLMTGLYLVGGLAIIWVVLITGSVSLGLMLGFAWFMLFVWLRSKVMRCPQCGADARMRPDGSYAGWVGTQCRHCGKHY